MAFRRGESKDSGKKQIRQASVCRSISEGVPLAGKIPQYGDVAVLREISAELGKIGSNLNQIAHHLNAGGSVYSVYYDLQEVIKDWNDMRFRMLKQVEDVCCGKYHYRRSA